MRGEAVIFDWLVVAFCWVQSCNPESSVLNHSFRAIKFRPSLDQSFWIRRLFFFSIAWEDCSEHKRFRRIVGNLKKSNFSQNSSRVKRIVKLTGAKSPSSCSSSQKESFTSQHLPAAKSGSTTSTPPSTKESGPFKKMLSSSGVSNRMARGGRRWQAC